MLSKIALNKVSWSQLGTTPWVMWQNVISNQFWRSCTEVQRKLNGSLYFIALIGWDVAMIESSPRMACSLLTCMARPLVSIGINIARTAHSIQIPPYTQNVAVVEWWSKLWRKTNRTRGQVKCKNNFVELDILYYHYFVLLIHNAITKPWRPKT